MELDTAWTVKLVVSPVAMDIQLHDQTQHRRHPRTRFIDVGREATVDEQEATAVTTETQLNEFLAGHRWNMKARGCECGWTQRATVPRGQEHINHPVHIADMLVRGGLLQVSPEIAP